MQLQNNNVFLLASHVSRKMRGYFSVIQKPKVPRGNIFLDVEICWCQSWIAIAIVVVIVVAVVVVNAMSKVT